MIITLQPRLVEPKCEKATMQERITNPSYILHEKAQQYYWEGRAPLSIKAFFSGQALYTLGKGYYAVDDASYLIVNHDQPYAITIEANDAVESFCLFFEPGLAEEVYCSLVTLYTVYTQVLTGFLCLIMQKQAARKRLSLWNCFKHSNSPDTKSSG